MAGGKKKTRLEQKQRQCRHQRELWCCFVFFFDRFESICDFKTGIMRIRGVLNIVAFFLEGEHLEHV